MPVRPGHGRVHGSQVPGSVSRSVLEANGAMKRTSDGKKRLPPRLAAQGGDSRIDSLTVVPFGFGDMNQSGSWRMCHTASSSARLSIPKPQPAELRTAMLIGGLGPPGLITNLLPSP